MAVDIIARAMASKGGGGGGTSVDAYTKEQTDTLLYNKADKSNVYTKSEIDTKFSETNENVEQNTSDISNLISEVGNKANSSAVYTKTESDSRFLGIEGTAVKAIADSTGANISESFVNVKSDIALNRTTIGYQCKNLLKNTTVSKTVNGVIFTVNDDKSITVSGKNTSSSTIFYNICQTGELSLEIGKTYIMTGCPTNNKDDNGKTLCYLRADKTGGQIASDTGNGVTFSTSETSNPTYALIWVSGNADFTDKPVTFYPMIRCADIIDATYEPYKPSLQEQITELISRVEALENK